MTTPDSREHELGDAIKNAIEDQRHSTSELRELRADRKRHEGNAKYQPGLLLFIVAAWAFIGYVWIARPAFIYEQQPAAALTPAQREARLRYAIYLQRARVDAFRTEHGRLPESLRETGAVESGVEYERTAENGYDVFGSSDGTVLRLSDRMSVDSFLGDARQHLPAATQ
ncbi:MAG: hypothetical protein ABIZ70_03555 [Gemmatimonadales bacterium]